MIITKSVAFICESLMKLNSLSIYVNVLLFYCMNASVNLKFYVRCTVSFTCMLVFIIPYNFIRTTKENKEFI